MSHADWRNPGAYVACQSLDAPGLAWEYLRRNAEFRCQRSKLEDDALRSTLDHCEVQAYTHQWGVTFPTADPDTIPASVAWASHALPSIVTLTALPPELTGLAFELAPVSAALVEKIAKASGVQAGQPASTVRVHVMPEGVQPQAALLPFDQLFEQRARAAIRAWRAMTGRNPGLDPAALPKQRRDRLVLALRALDGRSAKATYRDLAGELFGASVSGQAWKTHDLHDRTIRLVRYGVSMTQGGYRRLLLHPYRGRA